MIRIGCAVWAYPGWIGDLFPPGTRSSEFLKLYSRQLTTVEGNTTFYATPSPATVARWAAETPASFRFCCKLPREVSHAGPLAEKRRRRALLSNGCKDWGTVRPVLPAIAARVRPGPPRRS